MDGVGLGEVVGVDLGAAAAAAAAAARDEAFAVMLLGEAQISHSNSTKVDIKEVGHNEAVEGEETGEAGEAGVVELRAAILVTIGRVSFAARTILPEGLSASSARRPSQSRRMAKVFSNSSNNVKMEEEDSEANTSNNNNSHKDLARVEAASPGAGVEGPIGLVFSVKIRILHSELLVTDVRLLRRTITTTLIREDLLLNGNSNSINSNNSDHSKALATLIKIKVDPSSSKASVVSIKAKSRKGRLRPLSSSNNPHPVEVVLHLTILRQHNRNSKDRLIFGIAFRAGPGTPRSARCAVAAITAGLLHNNLRHHEVLRLLPFSFQDNNSSSLHLLNRAPKSPSRRSSSKKCSATGKRSSRSGKCRTGSTPTRTTSTAMSQR